MKEVYDSSRKKILGLLFISCCITLSLQYWKVTEHFDWVLYDMQMPLWSSPPPDDVVIIAIDEKSISRIGRWPWSRRIHTQLINKLTEYKSGPVVFNILFSESSNNNGLVDKDFSYSIAKNGQVILPVAGISHSAEKGVFELLPIPELFQAVHSIGHTDLELDIDSKFRRIFLYAGLNEARWPSLALAALFMNRDIIQLPGDHNKMLSAVVHNSWIRDNYVMIPFIGVPGHFKTFSYSDVLEGKVSADELVDKTIFIGATAKGLGSRYSTPLRLHNVMSGTEIQATIFEAIRRHNTIREMSLPVKLSLSFILTLLGSLIIIKNNWAKSQFYMIGLLITLFSFSEICLFFFHSYIPVLAIAISLIVTSLSISWFYLSGLQEAVDTDALTGLSNRRFFDTNFTFLWRMGARYQRPFSLLLIDIDFFKGYNDTYGHGQGDITLKQVAWALKKQARRAGDEACRIGGEEFAFLISNSDLVMAKNYAERIRKSIQALNIEHSASRVNEFLTVSIGVATIIPNKQRTEKEMFNVADEALYKAKDQGRNQVYSISMDY